MLKADLLALAAALDDQDLTAATDATRELTLSLSSVAKALGVPKVVDHYRQAYNVLGKARPIKTEQAPEAEAVLNILTTAMETIDRANDIVMRRQGRLTQADKRPLMALAQELEGMGADLMVALRRLPT